MNMFDQPELEAMLRANLKRYPHAIPGGNVEVTGVTQFQPDRVRVSFLDRVRGGEQTVQANYVLGCDGANSMVRAAIGSHMYGLPFTQSWVVIDVDTDAELNQWDWRRSRNDHHPRYARAVGARCERFGSKRHFGVRRAAPRSAAGRRGQHCGSRQGPSTATQPTWTRAASHTRRTRTARTPRIHRARRAHHKSLVAEPVMPSSDWPTLETQEVSP